MTNFEYLKSLDNEYQMSDIIMHFISTHLKEIVKNDEGLTEINSLPFLRWLQEEREN